MLPGEYALAVVREAHPEDLRDPVFLGAAAAAGTRVTLVPGQAAVRDFQVQSSLRR